MSLLTQVIKSGLSVVEGLITPSSAACFPEKTTLVTPLSKSMPSNAHFGFPPNLQWGHKRGHPNSLLGYIEPSELFPSLAACVTHQGVQNLLPPDRKSSLLAISGFTLLQPQFPVSQINPRLQNNTHVDHHRKDTIWFAKSAVLGFPLGLLALGLGLLVLDLVILLHVLESLYRALHLFY
ncbi:hypothetical protein DSO57_1036272 [Entomophthora muscae]|uniref:Uncharacterized protein n=1 Tax=Entomophthora muscae TaxID=34485 RepID=A0ACC2TLK4_9FUNG|nr:hypothetical protein DSO57_1036272 [Entomophthora muscae]